MSKLLYQRLATYTAAAAFLLILTGGTLAAGLVGLLALATIVAGWRVWRQSTVQMVLVALLGLMAAPVVYGGVTGSGVMPGSAYTAYTAYLAVAMLLLSIVLTLAVTNAEIGRRLRGPAGGTSQWLLPLGAVTTVYLTAVIGGYVKSAGAACTGWPLCNGHWIPRLADGTAGLDFIHRISALLAGVMVVATAVAVWRSYRHRIWMPQLAGGTVGLFLLAASLGALAAVSQVPPALAGAQLAVSVTLLAALVVLGVIMLRVTPLVRISGGEAAVSALSAPLSLRDLGRLAGAYIMLMKPRIIVLLLLTTYGAMWVAAGGPPPLGVTVFTLLGGTLSSGAANALNMYLDRDIDAVMGRTQKRPVPSGRLGPEEALQFGVVTGVLSFVLLAVLVNLISAVLATIGLLFYVFIYTKMLKRHTDQNIVIGGAAGAMPPLVGWAAITGDLGWAAVVMFLIVFLWTPAHFWALALFRKEDYARAGVPMMPVVRGDTYTKWQILLYALLTAVVSLALYPLGVVGLWYVAVAAASGLYWVWTCIALLRERKGSMRPAHLVFGYSILYLGIVFLAMVLDTRGLA